MMPHPWSFSAPPSISPAAAMTPSLSMHLSSVAPQAMPALAASLPQLLTHRPPGPKDWSPRGPRGIILEKI